MGEPSFRKYIDSLYNDATRRQESLAKTTIAIDHLQALVDHATEIAQAVETGRAYELSKLEIIRFRLAIAVARTSLPKTEQHS